MSNHVSLQLHMPEEDLHVVVDTSIREVPAGNVLSPIADYFDATARLKGKILTGDNSQDAEMLGLMIIGVISAAEFYYRSILGRVIQICSICTRQAEGSQVPLGAFEYYTDSDYSFVLGSMEHESLADAKRVATSIERFTGFKTSNDSSVVAALAGYELLCEVRHCLAHSRGFVGLKGSRALDIDRRRFSKVLVDQSGALELLKLAHNSVRAVNRFLLNAVVNRWIDRDALSGEWTEDRERFSAAWRAFVVKGEDSFGGNVRTAYTPVRKAVIRRRQAIAGKVSP